ncbi:MAG: TIGR02281 family clan AA aspartic protease [Pseudomonadota bacterium]
MTRYVFIALAMIGLAIAGPEMFQSMLSNPDGGGTAPAQRVVQAPAHTRSEQPKFVNRDAPAPRQNRRHADQKQVANLSGRTAQIYRASNGQYLTQARLNGRQVRVLVDTGASSVAINESTARRIGLKVTQGDFRHTANTANGKAKMAVAMIDRIEIGRVVVHNVRAAVLQDSSLDGTLLGMTFLNKLRQFKFDNGTMVLIQ